MIETKHVCSLCDFVFDEIVGDEAQGIAPGTKFEDLPDDYRHPNCSAEKIMFEACTCSSLPQGV